MAHLELINLRCYDQEIADVISQYIVPVLKQSDVIKNWDIKIYQHYRIKMEIFIHIINKIGDTKPGKSDFGLKLADNLKSFGAINHSIWNQLPL